jgi:anaerobic magnesium-protoporphyrin IX monomethyl ester cyclase
MSGSGRTNRKIERVFLLFPPVRLPRETAQIASCPLGVGYLAAAVRDRAEVQVMDAVAESEHVHRLEGDFAWHGVPLSEIRRRIERFRPDLVGITCLFSSVFPVVRQICREVKRIDPGIITMTGGTYPSFLAERCLREEALDLIAQGEGESVLLDLIAALRNGGDLGGVDGLAFKDDGRIVVNPKTRWIADLDSIPFPARDLLPMDIYNKRGIPHSLSISGRSFAPMITSRGCPARCIYCSSSRFWGNRYRLRSAENVLDEIGELVERWGIDEIQFEDDNMTAKRKRAEAIFRGIIEREYKIRFNFPNGVALWTLDEPLVDLMREAGCYQMTLAYESGSQEVLRNIVKKPTRLDHAARITEYIHARGIRTDAFFIIGFPGESREQIAETFRFADRMRTDIAQFFVANPLPGTELYELAASRGMLRDDFDFENLWYSRSAYRDSVSPSGRELEWMAARGFGRHALRSFGRKPGVFLKRLLLDLLLKRPGYTLSMINRIWRRNLRTL